ncbi:hypothetical protein AMTRI_Chr09g17450 [Amborella trichopoda]
MPFFSLLYLNPKKSPLLNSLRFPKSPSLGWLINMGMSSNNCVKKEYIFCGIVEEEEV